MQLEEESVVRTQREATDMADGDEDLQSPTGESLSLSRELQFAMKEDSHNDKEENDDDDGDDDDVSEMHLLDHTETRVFHRDQLDNETAVAEGGKEFLAPAAGMEFETYDDAYDYYNCYAKEVGFRVRVKNSWFKRHSKEKYGAVLCCSSQGFKRIKDPHRLRKETRTGCPAMIRMRLVDSKRWRVLEAIVEHNHLLSAKSRQLAKKLELGTKRIYKPLVIDAEGNVGQISTAKVENMSHLGLKKGDALAIYNYFCRMQLTNPSFFYLMDLGNDGAIRNIFWVDAKARAACCYFSDVVFLDNSYLAGKYEIPLVAITGINHHGQSVLLGCGILSGETIESYTWLFKIWLKCLCGRRPKTVVTDRCKILESAISEVFPGSHHRFSVSRIMKKVPEKLGGLQNYEAIKKALYRTVYGAMRVVEFETAWSQMVRYFGITDHEWLGSLFKERARWAPVYSRDVFFAGISILSPFFDKYIHKQTPLKEFLEKYELALYKKHKEETLADTESRDPTLILKTRCPFENQLSKIYTRAIFRRFQVEVEEMYSCFSTTQLQLIGPNAIFSVKERVLGESNRREIRDFEVLFNRATFEVCCVCNCFNFNGFLCRHALSVLNFNGLEEVPERYVLSRWKKDYKRVRAIDDRGTDGENLDEEILKFYQLYESALQVVEEGLISNDCYEVALRAIEESVGKVRGVEEKGNDYFR